MESTHLTYHSSSSFPNPLVLQISQHHKNLGIRALHRQTSEWWHQHSLITSYHAKQDKLIFNATPMQINTIHVHTLQAQSLREHFSLLQQTHLHTIPKHLVQTHRTQISYNNVGHCQGSHDCKNKNNKR